MDELPWKTIEVERPAQFEGALIILDRGAGNERAYIVQNVDPTVYPEVTDQDMAAIARLLGAHN